jgi:Glycosyl transferases group 1
VILIGSKILASLQALFNLLRLGLVKPDLISTFNLPNRLDCTDTPSWIVWASTSSWHLAGFGKNENHPFETAEVRLTVTIIEGLLALPTHPEMPAVAVVSINQRVGQLRGVFQYANKTLNTRLLPCFKGFWAFQNSLPFQEKLSETGQQLEGLSHLRDRTNKALSWQQKLKKLSLKGLFLPLQGLFSGVQQRFIKASMQAKTLPHWQGQGLCFGLIDFLNSPLTAQEPHPPTVIYFITEFDTQLLLDDQLQPIITELLPTVIQPNDVLLMPSFWHQSQFLTHFPIISPKQVRVIHPCVDGLFKLNKAKRKAIIALSQSATFLKTVGVPSETPFFLIVLDKAKSFRWFHTILAGFECFHDIRETDDLPREEADSQLEPTHEAPSKPKPHLVIVGIALADFPAYQKLLEEALPKTLQRRVHLHGSVPPSLLLTLYTTAKGLFYTPSERELGLGLCVLEALVVQCPVVISKVGHLEEWSEKASLLIEPHEPIQVAFAMAQLIDELDLAEALKHNGRKRSLLSGVEEFTQQLVALFDSSKTGVSKKVMAPSDEKLLKLLP